MKNNKKIILAAGAAALGLVAATGVTSGFAWFATNAQVGVNNMSILANSNNSYLLIHEDEVSKTILQEGQADPAIAKGSTAVNITGEAPRLTPVTYVAGNDATDMKTGTADLAASWKTGSSDNWDDETLNDTGLIALEGDLSNYVKTYTFTVGLAKNSAQISGFGISSVTVPADKGLKVIIASPTMGYAFSATNTEVKDCPLHTTLTQADVVVIKAYVFIEGNDSNVFSSNAGNLGGTISFTLKTPTPVTPAP